VCRSIAGLFSQAFRRSIREEGLNIVKLHLTLPRKFRLPRFVKPRTRISRPMGVIVLEERSHPENIEFELSDLAVRALNRNGNYSFLRAVLGHIFAFLARVFASLWWIHDRIFHAADSESVVSDSALGKMRLTDNPDRLTRGTYDCG
jgi:hypothetical protein